MNLCAHCDELIDPAAAAHEVHEFGCHDRRGYCVCDIEYVHPRCCRECKPVPVPGQVEAFPVASTRGLPKKRSGG